MHGGHATLSEQRGYTNILPPIFFHYAVRLSTFPAPPYATRILQCNTQRHTEHTALCTGAMPPIAVAIMRTVGLRCTCMVTTHNSRRVGSSPMYRTRGFSGALSFGAEATAVGTGEAPWTGISKGGKYCTTFANRAMQQLPVGMVIPLGRKFVPRGDAPLAHGAVSRRNPQLLLLAERNGLSSRHPSMQMRPQSVQVRQPGAEHRKTNTDCSTFTNGEMQQIQVGLVISVGSKCMPEGVALLSNYTHRNKFLSCCCGRCGVRS